MFLMKSFWVSAVGAILGATFCLTTSATAKPAPSPSLFGQLPTVYDAAISPNGKEIAILQNSQGQYLLNVVDLDAATSGKALEPRIVSFGDGVKPQYVKWVSNDRVMISVWQSQIYRGIPLNSGFLHTIDTQSMKARILIEGGGDVIRQFNNVVLDWLEDDPNHILMEFAGKNDDQTWPDVRKVNVKSGKNTLVKKRLRGVNDWKTDAEGVPRVGVGYRKEGEEAFMSIQDPVTGDWERAEHYPGIDPDSMSVVAVTQGGKSLILSAYRGKDTRGLHRYDLVNKTFAETIYQHDEYDVGNVILSKDGNEIVGASFVAESTERILFDAYDSTYEEALALFDGFDVAFVDQSEDASKILLRVSSPTDPGNLFLFERGGKVTRILNNLPGLDSDEMGLVIAVRYTARDGAKIPAFVTLPPTINDTPQFKNVPTIILPHGGPYSRDSKRFDYLAQFFATRGYAVLQMNFRGSEGYGKSFADAGRDSWVVMQEDVEDGMRWMLEKGYADPDKTCIAGWSYGGYAALMGAAKTPDLYKCSIAIAALSDIPEAIQDAKKYRNGEARAERTFGTLMADKALMRANNPVDHADSITIPVFMAHGEVDSAVEFDQFKTMKRQLEKADVDGTFMAFDDEDHYMSNQANRQAMLIGIDAFLRRVNGPSPFEKK